MKYGISKYQLGNMKILSQ